MKERNVACSKEEQCPPDILKSSNAEILAKWLSLFVLEVSRKHGGKYPPATIHLLLCKVQQIMRRSNANPFNIFDKKDVCFRGFRGTMESVYQKTVGTSCIHCWHICIHCSYYYMDNVATGGAFEEWTTMTRGKKFSVKIKCK